MKKLRSALGAILLSSCMPAALIPGLYNTGVDNAGVQLGGGSNGTTELHWQQNGTTAVTYFQNPYVPEALVGVGSDRSRWISIDATGGPDSNYTVPFTLTFDLTGLDPGTASITGRWAVDNCGSASLNGGPAFSTIGACASATAFTNWTAFSVNSGFVSGLNTLTFNMTNSNASGTAGSAAVRVEFETSNADSAVPEPAAFALAGLGLAGIAALRRRR